MVCWKFFTGLFFAFFLFYVGVIAFDLLYEFMRVYDHVVFVFTLAGLCVTSCWAGGWLGDKVIDELYSLS